MDPEQLASLQASLTQLLRHFDRACTQARAAYCLDSGTLLGAVRYGDWIPWDDDMDVVMWRSEYERLRSHLATHPDPQTHLWDPLRESGSGVVPRFTVIDSTVIVNDTARVGHPERARLCLDVFIMDDAPQYAWMTRPWLLVTHLLQIAQLAKGSSPERLQSWEPLSARLALSSAAVLLTPIPQRWIQRFYLAAATMFAERSSAAGYVLNGGRMWRRKRVQRDWFAGRHTVRFSGEEYPAPDAEAYLRQMYGPGFMTPLPPEDRTDHDLAYIDARLDGLTVHIDLRHRAGR